MSNARQAKPDSSRSHCTAKIFCPVLATDYAAQQKVDRVACRGRTVITPDRQRVTTDIVSSKWSAGARTRIHVVIRMLTGPSVMVGAGALISDAFFLIQSRAMVTL